MAIFSMLVGYLCLGIGAYDIGTGDYGWGALLLFLAGVNFTEYFIAKGRN